MILKTYPFLRNVFFIGLVIYFSQGALYAAGSLIGKFALAVILLMSAMFCLKVLLAARRQSMLTYSIFSLALINAVYYVFGGEYGGIYFSQLRNVLTALLPFFTVYFLTSRGFVEKRHLIVFFTILLPITILLFFNSRNSIAFELERDADNIVTNTAYMFVSLIPFVFLFAKKRLLSAIVMLILLLFIIQGAKRGAVIVGLFMFLIYAYYLVKSNKSGNALFKFAIPFLGICLLSLCLFEIYQSNEFLLNRMANLSEGGSGRDVIYANLIYNWYQSGSVINYLFGHGFVASTKLSGTGHLAHNDWLEILVNFGIFGVAVYVVMFTYLILLVLDRRLSLELHCILSSIFVMWFLKSTFSMMYTASSTALITALLGYSVAKAMDNRTAYSEC